MTTDNVDAWADPTELPSAEGAITLGALYARALINTAEMLAEAEKEKRQYLILHTESFQTSRWSVEAIELELEKHDPDFGLLVNRLNYCRARSRLLQDIIAGLSCGALASDEHYVMEQLMMLAGLREVKK
jgi:hypothetical protein